MRFYEEGEQDEVHRRILEGGIVYVHERVDTNEFAYIHLDLGLIRSNRSSERPSIKWTTYFDIMTSSGMFLTQEDAEKWTSEFTEGGCPTCGHGGKGIETIITEHRFG